MNVGEVEIDLGGKTETLRPSLGAAKRVNAAGGFQNVINRVIAFDFDYYVSVIAAGLNKKPQEIEDAVYQEGVYKLQGKVVSFVALLANGGKPLSEPEKDTGEA